MDKERQQIAEWYAHGLSGLNELILPGIADGATHVYHLFVVRTKHRDAMQKHLSSKGIGTMIHYPVPPHLQTAYKDMGFKRGDFPIAEEIAETCLSLPIWPGMQEKEVNEVAEALKSFQQ